MQTGTLEINGLTAETLTALNKLAFQKGKSATDLVREMIEVEVLSARSFDEVLAPIRQGFKDSGLSEDELDSLFEEAREDIHRDRQKKK